MLSLAIVLAAIASTVVALAATRRTLTLRALGAAAAGLAVVLFVASVARSGLRLNLTTSMPIGIYVLRSLPVAGVARGMAVAVCAPPQAAQLGRRRGYLARGHCPADTEPLLKIAAGVHGDLIAESPRGVRVDGCLLPHSSPLAFDSAGRLLSTHPAGRYRLGAHQVWLYAGNPRSWDSRYWGPVTAAAVVAGAVPLLVIPAFRPTSGEPGCGTARSAGPASSPG